LKTFNLGGVHPEENKLSGNSPIKVCSIPTTVSIPLAQNLGAASVPIVAKGEKVKVGQLIAKGEAFISSNIHSSVSGTVLKIDDIMDASGYRKKAIIINVEGDEWLEEIDRSADIKREISYNKGEIVSIVKDSGVVGLGGATFPTQVKLMVPEGKKAEYLIINGVECEPYLTSDHRLMLEKGEELLIGISILMKALDVSKALIGIENNKQDAIANLKKLAVNYKGIEVHELQVKYPQGGEKQLIKALINREVPSGKLPIEVGCVVNNVGTAFAVYEAVQKKKPLIERVVTITGKTVKNPSNYMVRIGTPLSFLLSEADSMPEGTGKVINGGPMMGKALTTLEIPVVKGMSGVVIMPEGEAKRPNAYNCIRCGKCISACPMGLEPYLIALMSEQNKFESCEGERVMDCMECGSCSFTCPSGRPLLDMIRVSKNKVSQIIRLRSNK